MFARFASASGFQKTANAPLLDHLTKSKTTDNQLVKLIIGCLGGQPAQSVIEGGCGAAIQYTAPQRPPIDNETRLTQNSGLNPRW